MYSPLSFKFYADDVKLLGVKFIEVLSIGLLLWKLWAFGFLFDISETFPCLVCLLLAKTGSGVHPASYPLDAEGPFPWGKAVRA
jgi:hypothetical protein